jgi:drug/metabolite transporter (DMT)-like permease
LVAIAFREEACTAQRLAGAGLGLLGVLCLGGAASYGFAGLWGRLKLSNMPPLTSAACQLTSASMVMLMLTLGAQSFARLKMPSAATWLALIGLAGLSTALAYVVFFRILARSGSINVMLVTLLVPIPSILLGHFALQEPVTLREVIGALVIATALLVIDGRVPRIRGLPK